MEKTRRCAREIHLSATGRCALHSLRLALGVIWSLCCGEIAATALTRRPYRAGGLSSLPVCQTHLSHPVNEATSEQRNDKANIGTMYLVRVFWHKKKIHAKGPWMLCCTYVVDLGDTIGAAPPCAFALTTSMQSSSLPSVCGTLLNQVV